MKTKRNKNREIFYNEKLKFIDVLISLPLILALGFIPLIVRLKVVEVDKEIGGMKVFYDFFSYGKVSFIFLSCIMAIILAFFLINKDFRIDKSAKVFSLFSGVYLLVCLVSTIFSKNTDIAMFGFPCQQEGFFTIVSVFGISVYGACFITTEYRRKIVFNSLYISSGIIFVIGILQYFGLDIIQSDFLKSLIVPQKFEQMFESILYPNSSGNFRNSIYSTLYNSNVFGTYAAMILAFAFSETLNKDRFKKMIPGIIIMFLATFALVGCYSRGAYVGALFAMLVVIVFSLKRMKSNFRKTITCSSVVLLSILIVFIINGGRVLDRLATIDVNTQDTLTSVNNRIRDFKINQSTLTIYFSKNYLEIEKKGENLEFRNDLGKVITLDYYEKDEGYKLNADKYRDFLVYANKERLFIKVQNSLLNFVMKNNTFLLADESGNIANISNPKTLLFSGMERYGSGRGYIWSRALPMVKNTIFFGYGPDNFYYCFPQQDYMGKLKFMYSAYIRMDMAHCMYLQSALETGVISMIILIAFLVWMFVSVIRKNGAHMAAYLGVIAAYAVCGIFTDANVCTMIVFWPLIAVCFGMTDISQE